MALPKLAFTLSKLFAKPRAYSRIDNAFPILSCHFTGISGFASPALADPSGYIAGSLGVLNFPAFEQYQGPATHLRASGTAALTPIINVQGDIEFEYRRDRFDTSGSFKDNIGAAGTLHVFYREPERFLLGGFAQFESLRENTYSDGELFYLFDFNRSAIGAEGQIFLDDVTLYGQVGYLSEIMIPGGDSPQSSLFATAQLRYFLTPDLKIEVHGLLAQASYPAIPNYSTTAGIGAGVEYRFSETPVSFFSTVDFNTIRREGNTFSDTRIMAGLKFSLGTDTLKDQDRNGASLDPYSSRPLF